MKASLRFAMGLLLCGVTAAGGQTLARKNWAGSGIRIEPWYESAIFYQIDPLTFQDSDGDGFGDLAGITARLGYLEKLGVDAIVLSPLPLEPPGGTKPFDPTYGSAEDFDLLEREANAHRMRVLVDLAIDTPHEQLIATARFWLSRGVAGLRLVGASPDRAQVLRELKAIAGTTRILVADGGPEVAVASRHASGYIGPRVAPEVLFDRRLTGAGTLTPAVLRGVLAGGNLLSDAANLPRSVARLGDGAHDVAMAKITAAAMLLGRGAPLLLAGQELGMAGAGDPTPMQWDAAKGFTAGTPWIVMGPGAARTNVAVEEPDAGSLLSWYRTLAGLHHTEAAVRTGSLEMLTVPNAGLVAWLRRAHGVPGVLVVVNLSAYAIVTPVSTLLAGGRGAVKELATSGGNALAGTEVTTVPVEPYGVWVGEVGSGAGLETVVLPARARRR